MGKKRRRLSNSQPGGFWRQEVGGAPMWFLALSVVAVVIFGGIGVNSMLSQPTAQARPQQPVPTFTYGSETPAAKPVAAFIGDSYTAGAGGTAGGFVPLVAAERGWDAVNLGRGGTGFITTPDQDPVNAQNACGQDYCESYPEMIPAAVSAGASIVVVSGGRNNSQADPAELEAAISAFYAELRSALPDAQIITTSPLWDDDAAPTTIATIAAWMKSATLGVGGTYVEIGQPLAGHADLISPDGVHPNDAGYRTIADAMLEGAH